MNELTIADLDRQSQNYKNKINIWTEINELYEGGELLDSVKSKYLSKRPGEPDNFYNLRLEKFTYTNNLALGINTLCNKLSTGKLNIEEMEDQTIINFRKDIDLQGTPETKFIKELFKDLLLYGTAFIHVDKPITNLEPKSLLEEKLIGINPYVTKYRVTEVLEHNKNFIKTKQHFEYRKDPFSKPVNKIIWTYITTTQIVRYSVLVEVSKHEKSINILDDQYKIDCEYKQEKKVEPFQIIEHGYSKLPVQIIEVDPELWLSRIVYLKVKEALRLENYIADALSIGTHLQRTYKPYRPPANESSFYNEDATDPQTGNTTVIKVDDFDIVEMTGTSVTVACNRLNELEQSISTMLTMKTLDKGTDNYRQDKASGQAKTIDYKDQEALLISYGQILRVYYQKILDTVADYAALSKKPYVHGFTSFELDTVSETLLLAQGVKTVHELLPESTLKAFSKRFSKLIMDTNNPDELKQLEDDIDAMNFKDLLTTEKVDLSKELKSDNTY